jgi:hypothetical protein
MWLVCTTFVTHDGASFYDARAIGDRALADAIRQAGRASKPLPPLPDGVTVPTLVKFERPGVF